MTVFMKHTESQISQPYFILVFYANSAHMSCNLQISLNKLGVISGKHITGTKSIKSSSTVGDTDALDLAKSSPISVFTTLLYGFHSFCKLDMIFQVFYFPVPAAMLSF